MSRVERFPEGQIETIARVLGECGSGTDISRVLNDRGLVDNSGQSTKWRRLYAIFLEYQRRHSCANGILDFIQSFITPSRFVGRNEEFETHRRELNAVLAFAGLEYGADGQWRKIDAARTIDEAEQRARTIRAMFHGRAMHPEVIKYCRSELLQDNYFHAVFEATKGLAQRIRGLTNIQEDGAALVDRVFSIEQPVLAFNTLQTHSEKSEHKGFATLIKGCFSAVRNPLAHEPKLLWNGADDAADYLTLVSLLHRKLDDCVVVQVGGGQS